MMFCGKCGAKIEVGKSFCENCGARVDETVQVSNSESNQTNRVETVALAENPNPKKYLWIIVAAVGVIIGLAVIMAVMLSRPKTIDLESMVKADFAGYDTVGTTYVYLDTEAFSSQLSDALGMDEIELLSSTEYSDCQNAVTLLPSKSSGLSNGDEITVTIEYDNEMLKEYKVEFSGKSVTLTVKGLQTLEILDPFTDLSVEFSGISPNGQAECVYSGTTTRLSADAFELDKRQGLKNGDTVTVSIPGYDEMAATSMGYKLTESSKTYTVGGLDEYVETYGNLTDEFVTYARQETEDMIHAYVAREYNDTSSVSDLEYAGYVFNFAKQDKSPNHYNELYILYCGTVSSSKNDFHDAKIYYPIGFYNILSSSGKQTSEMADEVTGYSSLSEGYWGYSTRGYNNPLVAYEELISSNKDSYTCESGDGFEKFESYTPISALTDIEEANLEMLSNRAQDIINSYLAEGYSDKSHANNLALAGEYLLFAKSQGQDYQSNNRLILVFSASVTNDKDAFADTTVYYPVCFKGLINLPNGEFMYLFESEVLGSYNFPDSSYYTSGYGDGTKMFSELVTAERTQYNYEVSDGLKQFGE